MYVLTFAKENMLTYYVEITAFFIRTNSMNSPTSVKNSTLTIYKLQSDITINISIEATQCQRVHTEKADSFVHTSKSSAKVKTIIHIHFIIP